VVLVDTSVWVEVFRSGDGLDLETILDFDEIVTCPPVVQEILQGIKDPGAHTAAREALLALPMVESPMALETWMEAAEIFRSARRAGFTVRSSVDCLIAACAARHSLSVLHHDRDFDVLAKVAAIEVLSA